MTEEWDTADMGGSSPYAVLRAVELRVYSWYRLDSGNGDGGGMFDAE